MVNIWNEHWVALRWCGENVWLLDSQEPRPRSLTWREYLDFVNRTWREYLDFVNRHKDAYRIEMAPDLTSSQEPRGAVEGGQPESLDVPGSGSGV